MKSRKKLICLAVAASLVMGAAFTGCTAVMNEADVKQTVATVNISKTDAFAEEFGEDYKQTVTEKKFLKRDMLTAFYNSYSSYTQMGYSYADIFEMIKDGLVSNAVTTQYATVYLLYNMGGSALSAYNAKATEAEKCEYILDNYDESAVARAKYTLSVTLNSVLDSAERNILTDEEEDEYTGSGTRSTPSGIDATVEEYVPANYKVYTGYDGYKMADIQESVDNGDYEPLYGTTMVSRQKAYASFLTSLNSNYLLTEADTETTDIWELSYVQESYVSQLQSEIITAFQDKIVEDQKEKITAEYVQKQYESLLSVDTANYDTASSFETGMGTLADEKFVLYSPSTQNDTENKNGGYGTFGYVYNILLPFSTAQEAQLAVLQSYRDSEIYTESKYFEERNKLLKNIVTTDQREAWFNGTTDYSFDASETELDYFGKDSGRNYLFFENNMTDTEHKQYEALEKYDGRYSYNGKVKKNTNGSYTLIPNKLSIDDMLSEFEAYINYVLTGDPEGGKVSTTKTSGYYEITDFTAAGEDKEIDYSKLVYATGKVTFADGSRENMLAVDSDRYKAMCAVNELQYAYTTDTGVLSQYIGYTVSAYDTSYIKEFEYAAQTAVKGGAGTFAVCAGDYGWHLIYVTETFATEGGEVYKDVEFTDAQIEKEGTFQNRFYNWIKDSHLAKEVTLKSNEVAKNYNNDKAVTVYKGAYKDLSELG